LLPRVEGNHFGPAQALFGHATIARSEGRELRLDDAYRTRGLRASGDDAP
jgi:hypothetical protein